MSALRPLTPSALVAVFLAAPVAGCGAAPADAANAPAAQTAAAAASTPASAPPRLPTRACAARAGASGVAMERTSKARHIPDESDPCADSTGAMPAPRR